MARIVTLGSALQDIYLVDRDDFAASAIGSTSIFGKIEIGTKIDIDKISYEIGGAGTNTAVTFARYGHDVIFMGNLSHDPAGETVLAFLDEEGIDTSYINYNKKGTGLSVILLDQKSGERTILTHRGASSSFSGINPEDLSLIHPDWLYISTLRGDYGILSSFIETANSLGIKTMFNPGLAEISRPDELLKLLPNIDILLMNKSEASKIVPGRILSELASHLSNYTETVIVTDSSNGGIAKSGDEAYRFGIYEDVKLRDSTGAGDAFGSGFLASLAAGKSFKDSLVYASANSTSVISSLGAKRGILSGPKNLHQMPIQRIDL